MATGFTKAQYREVIARVFGLLTGTATGGSTTTIVDSGLARFANDYFNGTQACVGGVTAWITDFAMSTGTLTVAPAFADAVGAGSAYQIYFRVSREDIDAALDLACAGYEVATSLTAKADSLDYYITSAPLLLRRQQIIGVWVREHNDPQNSPVEVQGWQLEEAEGQLTFRMPYTLNVDDGLWLVYYAAEHSVGDTDTLSLPLALVRARAVVHLLENRLNNTVDRDWYGTQLRYWGEKLQQEERKQVRAPAKARAYNWDAAFGGRAGGITPRALMARLAIDDGAYIIND
jgi:hypothetical protein